MRVMAEDGFQCLAPDLRGFGESPPVGEDPISYSVVRMADDVLELVDHLEIGNFILIGHSMGGKVALALAAQRPSALHGLILVAPSPPTPEPMAEAERTRLLAGHGDRVAAEETLGKITARALPYALAARAIADSLRASAPAWRAWLEFGSREDLAAQLKEIKVPVWIAVGAADKTITKQLVEKEIVARLRDKTPVHTISDAGHLLPLEAPTAIAELIGSSAS